MRIKLFKGFVVGVLLSITGIMGAEEVMAMEIKSAAFKAQEKIPAKYTCDGADASPPLSWTDVPEKTLGLALICDDPDAPVGTWVHWVIYDLPPETRKLPEGMTPKEVLENGARQGVNDFRNVGYGGPCPPPGPAHRYFFKLYALDTKLGLPPRATKKDVEKAMKGHILAQAELVGLYKR
ncbi:MAG: YbhB/YbcL family Raf kinase inhibitor-like protein, partial [Candidatus Brocadiales bacterium]|nr:YbhB/YbcL family Raf kinase inhibitor-like protein [Candidatus Brocadiales bacterium]